MTPIAILIVCAFLAGYMAIACESVIRVNKAAIALFMMVVCWTLFSIGAGSFLPVDTASLSVATSALIEDHLGSAATTLFFLMGAMTIVEIVDRNGGFSFVRKALRTTSKRRLLWRIAFMTFFLSAILDNLTTSIVMIMVLRKLVNRHTDRMLYAAMVVVAANSGGAFSPIGDVTTIMLWNAGMISAWGVIQEIFIPSLVSMVVPGLLLMPSLKGTLEPYQADSNDKDDADDELTARQRKVVFFLGVGGLIFVPVFRGLTGMPPFMGILLVLSVLWLTTELFYAHLRRRINPKDIHKRVSTLLSHIDMATILFFLGILMAVSCLEEIGVLHSLGIWLNDVSAGNHYLVTGLIGIISSIVDNVPLVAGCMGMYPIAPTGDMAIDGIFWQLLAYCAGVGGSLLIIGSAAGVVVMGLEKISFGWYMKRITPLMFVGYLAGLGCYWVIRALF